LVKERYAEVEAVSRGDGCGSAGVLGMDYGDFEVAKEVVKVYGACGSRSLARVWTTQ
jgi:hypothetical protein